MRDILVFYPDGTAPLWTDVVCATELFGGLLCFLSPISARWNPSRGVRSGDELLLRWPGEERRVRVELVRPENGGQSWACFVVRPRSAEA